MKEVKVEKLFNGKISLRDYQVDELIREGGVVIKLGNDRMYLGKDELIRGEKENTVYRSKWGDKVYSLVNYEWKPTQPKLV